MEYTNRNGISDDITDKININLGHAENDSSSKHSSSSEGKESDNSVDHALPLQEKIYINRAGSVLKLRFHRHVLLPFLAVL
jgi:hypothetical protein